MSEEFTKQWNRPSARQLHLLKQLASQWKERPAAWVDQVLVSPMDDGGMGSMLLWLPDVPLQAHRRFGTRAAECQFNDVDGVLVLASLYLDESGEPFELDVWKTDFSPIKETS